MCGGWQVAVTGVAGQGVGFRSERGPILLALMVAMALVALDSTVLATIVPSIVGGLGGFAAFPWLFSIYLLAQAVTVPVYAKLSDVIGRKPVLLAGIGIFLIGSTLGGLAWNMPALIAFRAVQGLGAGAIQPATTTIAGDIYTVAERARVEGYLSSVWAIASVLGPAVGGLLAQFATWRLVFFLNVPICIAAGLLLIRRYHETVPQRRRVQIDAAGSALVTAGLSLLILAVLEGGQAWSWDSPASIAAFAVGGGCLVGFVFVEKHSPSPVLPLWLFSDRLLLTTTLVSLGVGAVLIGLSSYVPTYLERAGGAVPLIAGLAVAANSIGWPLAATASGRVYLKAGFRATTVLGAVIMVAGSIPLVVWATAANSWLTAACCLVVGAGLGFSATPTIVAAQSMVAWERRGVVTGSNMLARAVGSAVGVAIFGAIANSIIAKAPHGTPARALTVSSSAGVFVAVVVCALLVVLAAVAMPRHVDVTESA